MKVLRSPSLLLALDLPIKPARLIVAMLPTKHQVDGSRKKMRLLKALRKAKRRKRKKKLMSFPARERRKRPVARAAAKRKVTRLISTKNTIPIGEWARAKSLARVPEKRIIPATKVMNLKLIPAPRIMSPKRVALKIMPSAPCKLYMI